MTTPTSADAALIASQSGPGCQLRVGVVVSFTPNSAQVSVGGRTFTANFHVGTTLTVGAQVSVLNQSGSWLILGTLAGVNPNLLAGFNPSFENSAPGTFPVSWQFANTTGTASAVVLADPTAPDGDQIASVASTVAGSSVSYLYSGPIGVATGDQFQVSAFAGGDYDPGIPATGAAALVGLWFANSTNLYPTTSSADTVIVSVANVVDAPPFTTLTGIVTAPVNGYMRLALRSTLTGFQRMTWDQAIVRKV